MEYCNEIKFSVALIISHPIQHFCPQYASFARNEAIDFKVFFASSLGCKKYFDTNFGQEISWDNLNLDKFNHEFLNNGSVLPSSPNLDAPELDAKLKAFGPQVVVVYGYFQKLQRRAYRWAVRNKKQIAYISDSEHRQKRPLLKRLVKYLWVRNYFSCIDYFLTVGDANEDFYRSYGVKEDRFLRMHFPIDVEHYRESYGRKEEFNVAVRRRYGIAIDEPVICVVGKLVSWKNQDHLIEVIKKFEAEGKILHLFILGSGPMMEEWKQKASSLKRCKVIMPGFVSISELPAYYAASDIYVHPASVEPHSLAISEAIYMGCPIIISSRCGSYGSTDDVQEEKNGFVYEFGDLKTLKEKITSLLSDDQKRKTFGLFSHQLALRFQERSHFTALDELKRIVQKEAVRKEKAVL